MTPLADVVVVETGTANIASVVAALARLGRRAILTRDAEVVRTAACVVVPGVGTFGAAVASIDAAKLRRVLTERVARDQALFGICLGMQVFGDASEESPGATGLGTYRGVFRRFPQRPLLRVPQFGWNRIEGDGQGIDDGYAYFANSYRLEEAPAGWSVAWADHGGPFVAALERGATTLCQFHPEVSGTYGATCLQRWLERSRCLSEVTA